MQSKEGQCSLGRIIGRTASNYDKVHSTYDPHSQLWDRKLPCSKKTIKTKNNKKKTLKPLGTDVYTIKNGWIFINTGSNKLITQLTHTQTEFSLTEAKKLVIISS